MPKELAPPAAALLDDSATECLVDLARHVARAYAQTRGDDPNAVLARIRAGLDAEWSFPTDEPRGAPVS